MGKAENLRSKKKKGRPSLSDLRHRENKKFASTSTRRNPNSNSESPPPEFVGDDDDERKEKKVKLVVRLPESNNQHQHLHNSSSGNWASESDPDGENREASVKKRKINAVNRRSTDVVLDQEEKGLKATDTQHGSPLVFGPTTPLPDKKLLVFILDRLQKKDTYGVFAEPVDPNELPDYHEIIEHPMDFGSVRKKLDGGLYSNLEELEADVILICSNAMEYNAPDTIYYRQARSIQDLAKRDFGNLRHEGDDGEPQPKVVRRGRPPSKNMKKPLESSPVDCVAPELSSGAAHASGEDKAIGSNSYNLRKGTPFYRFHSTDASLGNRSRNGETYSEWSIDWNQEFPASILRADMKYGKKHFSVDENKRYTYKQVQPSASGNESSLFSNANGDVKQLNAVGLHGEPHAYARSLARFAANLGPVAWKVASKKLQHVLPPGVEFGPGWVGERGGPPPQVSLYSNERQTSSNSLASDYHSSRPVTPPAPSSHSAAACVPSEAMIEAVRRLNSQNEMAGQRGMSSWTTPGSSSQAQQQPLFYPPYRNGTNGVLGNNLPTHMDRAKLGTPKMHTTVQDGSVPSHMISMVSGSDTSSSSLPVPQGHLGSTGKNLPEFETRLSGESGLVVSGQHRHSFPVPPDLNVKVQPPGSPSSGLQIGSPQQPDLALQL